MRLKPAILIIIICVSWQVSCTKVGDTPERPAITYTEVQGDQTTVILDIIGHREKMPNVEVRPLIIPAEVLNYEPYVLSLSTGSTAIDAYLLDVPWVKRYQATNWLSPIDMGSEEFDLAAFKEELISATSINVEGKRKILAIPFETKGNMLFYRKDLLDEFGYDPPEDWETLFRQCHAILNSRSGDSPRFGLLYHINVFINDFYPIMWGFGGSVKDESGNLAVDTPENVRALSMVKGTLGTISPTPTQMIEYRMEDDYKAIDRLFASGEAIFMINWNIRLSELEHGIEGQRISLDKIGVAPIPSEKGQPRFSNIGSFGWGINFFSRNQKDAKKLIQLLTSFEAQKWRALNNGVVPARWDVMQDKEVRDGAPSVITMLKVFEKVQLRARPFEREINVILNDALVAALTENGDPLLVLREAQRRIEEDITWVNRCRAEVENER